MVHLTILYFCLPTLLLAAPAEDSLKQQLASGLMRNDESNYWNYINPDNPIHLQLRSLDSLGRGHLIRSLGEPDTNWLGSGGNNGNFGWRFNGYNGGLKRGGGLDSLGRGNILRSLPLQDEFQRSLDSLGRGNILKRSTRDSR